MVSAAFSFLKDFDILDAVASEETFVLELTASDSDFELFLWKGKKKGE